MELHPTPHFVPGGFLSSKSMFDNFSNHTEQESKNWDWILNEMQNFILFKFCNSVLSFPSYKLLSEKFGMHSLSLLHKTASVNFGIAAERNYSYYKRTFKKWIMNTIIEYFTKIEKCTSSIKQAIFYRWIIMKYLTYIIFSIYYKFQWQTYQESVPLLIR